MKRHEGDILVGVDVSGQDYKIQWEEMHRLTEWQKSGESLKAKIFDYFIPDDIELNYFTLLSRSSSMMIRQNSVLMAQLIKPDMLMDVQMNRYGMFDFDESEKIIALGQKKAAQVISEYERG